MKPGLHTLLSIAAGVAIANLAWVVFQRSPAPPRAARKADVWTGFDVPGPGVKILQFYSSRAEVIEGEHTILCYGVANAKAVRIDPPVEQIEPAHNRCISVTPDRTTTYTLRADGNDGSVDTVSFTVNVAPAPPFIRMAALSDKIIRRGEPVTLCTAIDRATSARIEPINRSTAVTGKPGCVKWYPVRTLNYRIVAKGVGGEDAVPFKVAVR